MTRARQREVFHASCSAIEGCVVDASNDLANVVVNAHLVHGSIDAAGDHVSGVARSKLHVQIIRTGQSDGHHAVGVKGRAGDDRIKYMSGSVVFSSDAKSIDQSGVGRPLGNADLIGRAMANTHARPSGGSPKLYSRKSIFCGLDGGVHLGFGVGVQSSIRSESGVEGRECCNSSILNGQSVGFGGGWYRWVCCYGSCEVCINCG